MQMRSAIVKKSATLREQVFRVVVSELKSGRFAPGERITEEGLAQRLGVSRTPIREALGQLTKQGVLRAREGGGYVVPSPSIDEVRQIIAVRALLEPAAVRMAAAEYGPTEVEVITKAIEAESASASRVQPGQFARANEAFRHAMFDRISNRMLSSLIAQFASHLHFIRGVTLDNLELRKEIVDRQRKIRDAIEKHDGDLAEGLWRSYLRLTEDAMTNAMRQLAGKSPRSRPLKESAAS
jgi:DNA-binding GntR family transcriptional regulator